MNQQPFVSIIIPAYNVEKYLADCLQSILSQPFDAYEVILVDDGSTDQTHAICQMFAKQEDKIVCLQQKNGGVSSARNLGLSVAKGTWIWFVDGDDTIAPMALPNIANWVCANDAQLYVFGSPVEETLHIPDMETLFSVHYVQNKLSFSACNKWYERKVIQDHHLTFDTEEAI